MIDSQLLDARGLKSLSSLCMEATTAELNELHKEELSIGEHVFDLAQRANVDNVNVLQSLTSLLRSTVSQFKAHHVPDVCNNPSVSKESACISSKFDLNVVAVEVEGEEIQTGRFQRKRLNPQVKPTGDWPKHWLDTVHETDGHNIDALNSNRGEKLHLKTA